MMARLHERRLDLRLGVLEDFARCQRRRAIN
jgi:hypothetical protein